MQEDWSSVLPSRYVYAIAKLGHLISSSPGICLAWGAVIVGFGFTKTWPSLIPLRLVLGLLESGYFPGKT